MQLISSLLTSTTIWSIAIGLYTLIAITIIISLLLHGVRPTKTLAWILAIFTIPVGGILLYLMLGRNRRKQKFHLEHYTADTAENLTLPELELSEKDLNISRAMHSITGFGPKPRNEVLILKDGAPTFEAIFKALEGARKYIHVQYYIFEEGDLADRLFEIFRQKIAQQVRVRLIYDSIGSYSLSRRYRNRLREIGVEVYSFLPMRYGRYLASLKYRNHRKIIVVDGEVGFTGGINISDKYLKGDSNLGTWHDMHLQLSGPAAADLNRVFIRDWKIVSGSSIPSENNLRYKIPKDPCIVQIVPDSPDDDHPTIEHLFLSIIRNASRYLYIINPYIIPSLPIQRALENAALSGVDVRFLISEKADSKLVTWCVRSYFEALLSAGIRLYLFPDGFLHSKIAVSDDEVATIGTSNLDERSFQQNYEVNALIYNNTIAKSLKDEFLAGCRRGYELTLSAFSQRHFRARILEGIARVLSPLL